MRVRLQREISVTIVLFILLSSLTYGQTYSFKNYGIESNIPNPFVYTINQDDNGYLWVGTGQGLAKFDGFDFYNVTFPDSAVGRYPTTSLKDSNGTLWFGCNDGTVFYTEANQLRKLEISNTREISELLEGPEGYIYIIPQGQSISRVNPVNVNEIKSYEIDGSIVLFSAAFTESGDLLLGTQENIQICRVGEESITLLSTIEGFDYYNVLEL